MMLLQPIWIASGLSNKQWSTRVKSASSNGTEEIITLREFPKKNKAGTSTPLLTSYQLNCGFSLNPNGLEKTMLVRLLYVSTEIAKQPSNFAEMNLEKFRLHNKASEITGVLLSGNGVFLQVLEGDRSKINQLYANILNDQRHKDIELLHYEEIDQRVFFAWSMDYIPMSSFYELIKVQDPDFDPYLSSGKHVHECINDYLRLNDEP
jgi:hypothetical protein